MKTKITLFSLLTCMIFGLNSCENSTKSGNSIEIQADQLFEKLKKEDIDGLETFFATSEDIQTLYTIKYKRDSVTKGKAIDYEKKAKRIEKSIEENETAKLQFRKSVNTLFRSAKDDFKIILKDSEITGYRFKYDRWTAKGLKETSGTLRITMEVKYFDVNAQILFDHCALLNDKLVLMGPPHM